MKQSNIKDLRENIETEFCDWFSDVKRIVEDVGSEISVPRIANSTTDGTTPEGYYRVNVAVPFLDHLHQEMSNRFDHESRVGNELFNLVPSIIITLSNLQPLAEGLLFWKLDMPSLLHFYEKLCCGKSTGQKDLKFLISLKICLQVLSAVMQTCIQIS